MCAFIHVIVVGFTFFFLLLSLCSAACISFAHVLESFLRVRLTVRMILYGVSATKHAAAAHADKNERKDRVLTCVPPVSAVVCGSFSLTTATTIPVAT